MRNKKGQLDLGQAPAIILVVGLIFLVMATMALIGEEYGDAVLITEATATVEGEDVTAAEFTGAGYTLSETAKNSESYAIVALYNNTDELLLSGNYTLTGMVLTNASVLEGLANMKVNYTYIWTPETVAYNVTTDLQTELSNNTSIAGIVLTISLVGIVFTILIGVFVGLKRPRI